MSEPRLERRPMTAYCAVPVSVTMGSIGAQIPPALDELERYMASRGIQPAGPSVVRYRRVSLDEPFTVEAGWVIEEGIWIDAPFVADALPEGRYAVLDFHGPFSDLGGATSQLIDWAHANGMALATDADGADDQWACWCEVYLDDPVMGPLGPSGPVQIVMLTATDPL